MPKLKQMVFAAALLAPPPGGTTPNTQQDFPGNPVAGEIYARQVCGECHDLSGTSPSYRPGHGFPGRSFRDIAHESGTTFTALLAWLTATPHPTMPDLILSPENARDVVSYILSLKPPEAQ